MADQDAAGGRYYRAADEKLADAVTAFNADPRIDFVMMMGDFVDCYGNTDAVQALADLQQIEAVYDGLVAPRYYVIGNHDMEDLTLATYQANTGMASGLGYYLVDVNDDVRVVVLDACYTADDDNEHFEPGDDGMAACWINPAQRTWLQNTALNTAKAVVVFIHQNLHNGDVAGYDVNNDAAVRAILEGAGNVRHVFQGHRHHNVLTQVNGIYYHNVDAVVDDDYPANAFMLCRLDAGRGVRLDGYGGNAPSYRVK